MDVTGYFYGDDLLNATEAGKWASYVFLNPATGEQAQSTHGPSNTTGLSSSPAGTKGSERHYMARTRLPFSIVPIAV